MSVILPKYTILEPRYILFIVSPRANNSFPSHSQLSLPIPRLTLLHGRRTYAALRSTTHQPPLSLCRDGTEGTYLGSRNLLLRTFSYSSASDHYTPFHHLNASGYRELCSKDRRINELEGRIEEDRMTYEINRSLLTGFFPFPFGVSTHICFPNEIASEASD
jgi:hypothetical protein